MHKWTMIVAMLLLAACGGASGGISVQGTTNFNDVAVDSVSAAGSLTVGGELTAAGDVTLGDAAGTANGTQIELRDAEQTIALGNLDTGAALRVDTANGKLLASGLTLNTKRPLQGKTANFTLSAGDTRALAHNLGAVGAITFTLPAAEAGLDFCFYVGTAQIVNVKPATGDQIAVLTTAVNGIIKANAAGNAICLVALDTTNWAAYSIKGTWVEV